MQHPGEREIIAEANAAIQTNELYRNRSAIVIATDDGGGYEFVENGQKVAQTDPLFGVFATTMQTALKKHGFVS